MLSKLTRPLMCKWDQLSHVNRALKQMSIAQIRIHSRMREDTLHSKMFQNPLMMINMQVVRESHGGIMPKTQYDIPIPDHLYKPKAFIKHHWELLPIVIISAFTVGMVIAKFIYDTKTKLDCVYDRVSLFGYETFDLCHPTVHKLVTLNQCYEPWPEMAGILADMDDAEECLLAAMAAGPCPPPKCT